MRFIPRKTKVKSEVFKGFTFLDIGVATLIMVGTVLLFTSNIPYSTYIAISFFSFGVMLFVPVSEGVKLYFSVVLMFKFFAYKKRYYKNFTKKNDDIRRIIPFEGLSTDKFISFGTYYASVIEISPAEFFLFDENKRDYVIRTFANAFGRLSKDQKATLVKVKKPMILDNLIKFEDNKFNTLIDMSERGLYVKREIDARSPVFEERLNAINYLNNKEKILKNYYYMVIYDTDREALEGTTNGIISTLASSQTPIATKMLYGDELLVFVKSTFTDNFDERELQLLNQEEKMKWACPESIRFKVNGTVINDKAYRTFSVTDYPIEVPDAWMYPIFEMDDCRVVVNITPIQKHIAEKTLDKSLMEMETKLSKDMKTSAQIEAKTHYDTLKELLTSLKTNNENLFNVNIHITAEEGVKREVRSVLKQNGFKYSENFGRQVPAFVSANVSRLDTLSQYERGIHTGSIAAGFPFISSALQDDNGLYIGYNQYPVFVNFFTRNSTRVNSNMIVVGKSGSGKSFATKVLLTNFAADNTRIFIVDPENEYERLCKNLGGKIIDVGSSINGIFNPFHIYPTLAAEEGGDEDTFSDHLRFLEQFFRVILVGINPDAFETINSTVVELYKRFKIDSLTEIDKLKPKDFPIFDDLLKLVNEGIKKEKEQYRLRNLLTVKTYIEKFAKGGRNSNLWNGPTSIKTNENFICFNFRSLVSSNNDVTTNAQMLLVFKYLNNEIIKNKDFNDKYFAPNLKEEEYRRVVVAVDEAHVFVNKKYPVALDFMKQMAKRIRKYKGMQIVITQNIKDFVGSPEIAQESTAIINASQYSLIFSLSPNDMSDLVELYRNAGGINEEEKDSIVTAKMGQGFLIIGALNRTSIQIESLGFVKDLFEKDFGDKGFSKEEDEDYDYIYDEDTAEYQEYNEDEENEDEDELDEENEAEEEPAKIPQEKTKKQRIINFDDI